MYPTSQEYARRIDTQPGLLILRAGGTPLPPAAVLEGEWTAGLNAGDELTMGCAVAGTLRVTLDRATLGAADLADAHLSAAYRLRGLAEDLPIGTYRVMDADGDDDRLTLSAVDALGWAFEDDYDLDDQARGWDWETGVDAEALLLAVCQRCGITAALPQLTPVSLRYWSPAGYTYREIVGLLAGLWGMCARMDPAGRLTLAWYAAADRPVGPSRYYQGGLEKAAGGYALGYLKCYAEPLEETLAAGDAAAGQGVYLRIPWMTQERLDALWQLRGGFAYRPGQVRFLGDPRVEPGDLLTVTDRDGTAYQMPVMEVVQTYDGGLITQIRAVGRSEAASQPDYEGPVTRGIEKRVEGVTSSIIRRVDSIDARVEDAEGNLSEIEQTVDSITLSVTSATGGDGQTYATIRLQVGPNAYSGQILLDGNVDVSGQLSADALYTAYGDMADLTVDRLKTSRRIPLYLAGDTRDDNYLHIVDESLEMVAGVYAGGTEQARNPNGLPLYWEADPAGQGVVIGSDGYPYLNGTRIFMTTSATQWPVTVYTYTDTVKARLAFEQALDGTYQPMLVMGAGDGSGANYATMFKATQGLELIFRALGGRELGLRAGYTEGQGAGYLDLYGLRKTTRVDFSGWDGGSFTETLDGGGVEQYSVTFDSDGRPVAITDGSSHVTEVVWQ